MKETLKLGIILLLFSVFAAGVLGFTNKLTSPIIDQRQKEETEAAYKELVPDADEFVKLDADKLSSLQAQFGKLVDVIIAKKGGTANGALITTKGGGYGGDITILTGVDAEGKMIGIKILDHKETPDIGTKIEQKDFQDEFVGLSATENVTLVATKKEAQDVEKISGSTVSSKGVMAAVNLAIDTYKELVNEL